MDNDIVADCKAVEELYLFMEQNPEVGMVGSKVYFMDYPNQIWGYGGHIDFEDYIQKDHYKNMVDSEIIPDVDYCDYVAACSLMARTDAIKKVGLMPEDNFIYWDDIEWGYRFNQQGYKVAVCGKSKIWHKAGGRNSDSTFIHYYMWRNRISFFLKSLDTESIEDFGESILSEMYKVIYSVNLKGETNIIRSLMFAFNDAINGIKGKAANEKIFERNRGNNRVEMIVNKYKKVAILFNGDIEGLLNIIRNIRSFNTKVSIGVIVTSNDLDCLEHYSKYFEVYREEQFSEFDLKLIMCKHIFELTIESEPGYYIDAWCNIICSEEDFKYSLNFELTKKLFILCQKSLLINFHHSSNKNN